MGVMRRERRDCRWRQPVELFEKGTDASIRQVEVKPDEAIDGLSFCKRTFRRQSFASLASLIR